MTWRVDNLEPVVAEGDDLAVGEVMLGHGNVIGIFLVNLGYANGQMVPHNPFVILVDLGQEAIAVADQVIAVQVVVMGMSEQQAHRVQSLGLNEANQALALAVLVHTAVDDDGLARLIPNDVSTLGKHVHHKFLYLDHTSINICQSNFAGANIHFLSELERHLEVKKCVSCGRNYSKQII